MPTSEGTVCFYAPEDLKIGDEFRQRIAEAIRRHDKLLLIFSQWSVRSDWVQYEVEAAIDREKRQQQRLLPNARPVLCQRLPGSC